MRITLLNTHDLVGGAERCSYDLARLAHASGDDVELIVGRKLGADPFVREILYRPVDWRLRQLAHERFGLTEAFIPAPLQACRSVAHLRSADVFNVHNLHGAYWNFWTLPILASRAPLVLTLHDEWLLTGDCAYTYDCNRWKRHCGSCPQALQRAPEDRVCIGGGDATWFNLKLKRSMLATLRKRRVTLVTPSDWLARRIAEAPGLRRFPTRVIPYGVDLEVYRPLDRAACRAEFGLPKDGFAVFVPAVNLFDQRKNASLLLEAAARPDWPKNAFLVLAGHADRSFENRVADLPHFMLDYLNGPQAMAKAFGASDLVVVPSLADNLPYVALEAQACGRPVLASTAGGIPETIEPEVSGWLFDPARGAGDLACRIAKLETQERSFHDRFKRAARARAERSFGLNSFASSYRSLFEELVAGSRPQH